MVGIKAIDMNSFRHTVRSQSLTDPDIVSRVHKQVSRGMHIVKIYKYHDLSLHLTARVNSTSFVSAQRLNYQTIEKGIRNESLLKRCT